MRQGKVAGFRWQVEMENPEILLLLGENGLKNQKANPRRVRCKNKWSARLDGNANLSKTTLHPASYRSGWKCESDSPKVNMHHSNRLRKYFTNPSQF
jgi:hypothetical protein